MEAKNRVDGDLKGCQPRSRRSDSPSPGLHWCAPSSPSLPWSLGARRWIQGEGEFGHLGHGRQPAQSSLVQSLSLYLASWLHSCTCLRGQLKGYKCPGWAYSPRFRFRFYTGGPSARLFG
eukprot:1156243-Pelagomonas_calceolata.AAC.1